MAEAEPLEQAGGAPVSIQRLSIRPDRDQRHHQCEGGDRPQLGKDLRGTVALKEDAADDAERMRRRENLSRPLRPDWHPEEREHETGEGSNVNCAIFMACI